MQQEPQESSRVKCHLDHLSSIRNILEKKALHLKGSRTQETEEDRLKHFHGLMDRKERVFLTQV